MVASGRVVARARTTPALRTFNGVKVFSATMFATRESLGESVTAWLAAHSEIELVDIVVTQSSDAEYHCLAITVFYFEQLSSSQASSPSTPRRAR
jgi:hypothetical protein